MTEVADLTPDERRYFDTRGAEGPPEAASPAAPPEPALPAGGGAATSADDAAPEPAPARDGEVPRVPIHALHEARAEARALRERMAQQEARFQRLVDAVRQPEEAAPAASPVEQDPVAALKRINAAMQEREAAEQRAGALQQLSDVVAAREATFAETHPDYRQAIEHLRAFRDKDLETLGYQDPAVRRQMIRGEAASIAAHALRTGRDPAAVAYELARRWGWQGGASAVATAAADPAPARAKLDAAEQGLQAARSLSGAPGAARPALSLESVAAMSDDEFGRITPAQWRRLMGG